MLRGLEIEGTDLRLKDNEATVWIEDCSIHHNTAFPTYYLTELTVQDSSPAVLIRANVVGGPSGFPSTPPFSSAFRLLSSDAHVWESILQATVGGTSNGAGAGTGATVNDSFLFAAGSTFRGGRGKPGTCNRFGQCCDGPGGPGGAGLDASLSGVPAITLACTFQGGAGGLPPPCAPPCSGASGPCIAGPTGPATIGAVLQEPLTHRSYQVTTPVQSGTSYQLDVSCPPGEFVWSVFSRDLDPTYVPNYFGTQVSPLPVTLVFEGVANATGKLTKTVPIPRLPFLLDYDRVFAQGLFFDQLNNAYLGSASVLVVVN